MMVGRISRDPPSLAARATAGLRSAEARSAKAEAAQCALLNRSLAGRFPIARSASRRAHARKLADRGREGIEGEANVLVGVGERNVIFALPLQDAALAQEAVAALHRVLVAHRRAIVG